MSQGYVVRSGEGPGGRHSRGPGAEGCAPGLRGRLRSDAQIGAIGAIDVRDGPSAAERVSDLLSDAFQGVAVHEVPVADPPGHLSRGRGVACLEQLRAAVGWGRKVRSVVRTKSPRLLNPSSVRAARSTSMNSSDWR